MMLSNEDVNALLQQSEDANWTDYQFAHAVIEANNAKVLADLTLDVRYYDPDAEETKTAFSPSKVSALIQHNEALTEMLKPFAALSQDHQKLHKDDDPLFQSMAHISLMAMFAKH